jgi:hypothetical protein
MLVAAGLEGRHGRPGGGCIGESVGQAGPERENNCLASVLKFSESLKFRRG